MTYWSLLLHFYQPPTQTHDVLARVARESYRPLIRVLREHENARVAVNVQGVLTELLLEHGLGDVVAGLRELAEAGKVEFVGSAKFHAILPLIPEAERKRQIAENARSNRAALGRAWNPRGFFPPEMCYSDEVVPSVHASGHEWLVVSGVACPVEWPTDVICRVPVNGAHLRVLFRDDIRSNRISFRETDPEAFLRDLGRVGEGGAAYVMTAMDAETYGHHIRDWEREFLGATLEALGAEGKGGSQRVEMVFPSELLELFPDGAVVEPHASSWSTSREDLAAHNPFPLWKAPGNRLHELQWEYVDHCLDLVAVGRRYATSPEAKEFAAAAYERLGPALHSCQFWWASRRPMWSLPMIYRGFLLLNQVATYAAHSIAVGEASEPVKREARWRLAAANETRLELERELIGSRAP
jgi:alpha-amylase/alpha-mannosidase (GH57 family)